MIILAELVISYTGKEDLRTIVAIFAGIVTACGAALYKLRKGKKL